MRPLALALALALGLTVLAATSARADGPPPEVRAGFAPDGALVRLTTSWGKGAAARLRVGKARAVVVHDGAAAGAIAVGHDRVVIALATDLVDHPFQVIVRTGADQAEPVTIDRPGDRHDVPFAVAATATPEGFAVFFQEVEAADPSAAHTYLVELDAEGAPTGAATEVPVPWSLVAAAWNGDGYHLALIYSGDAKGMRLSMVSVTRAGQPQQHPDWASRAGFIADVHLVAADGKVRAFYRGGGGGDRLLESDVTAIRSWGGEPPKARDRGALSWTRSIAITADGKPARVAAKL